MIYCRLCLTPSTRPRVTFVDGVCNGCLHAAERAKLTKADWDRREDDFRALLRHFHPVSGYDCVLAWSGGKDSSSIAYRLKNDYNLNPLLVTFAPLLPTTLGQRNREALLAAGFDSVMVSPNPRLARDLSLRFLRERGNPKVAWDAGVNAAPLQIADQQSIPLVFYAEHGESFYGGKVLHADSSRVRDHEETIEHQIGDDPSNWGHASTILPYLCPRHTNTQAIYFAHYHPWNVSQNFELCLRSFGFEEGPLQPGTWTTFDSLDDDMDWLYYHLQYLKFGFGRASRDSSRCIQQNGGRPEDHLVFAKAYDGEIAPVPHLRRIADYYSLSVDELFAIIESHRNPALFDGRKLKEGPK